jgi:translation initiation factor 2 subunit 1
MEKERELPDIGETVVCKVRQVLGYGAFVELIEFGDKKGFVHVSQVASRWVKNIRSFVKEGQIRAAKVLSIDRARGQIDLSFNKVSSQAQRARIEEWKQLKRGKRLLDILAKSQGVPFEQAWEAVAIPLLENYDSLGEAFQGIALLGEEGAEGVEKSWLKPLVELVQKSVPVPQKTLGGFLFARSLAPNGVDVLKEMLAGVEKNGLGEIRLFYSGGGKYDMRATAPDFKSAEKLLGDAADAAIRAMKAANGDARFEKGA